VNEWTCVKIVEYYRAKIKKKKNWETVLDNVKKDLQKVAEVNSGFDATRRRKAQEIVDRWKHWTAPIDRNMDNQHFKIEFQKMKQQVNATGNAVTHITDNCCTKHSRSNNEEKMSNAEATASLKRMTSSSPVSDGENEKQDEPIEIDLMRIKKQLE
ncbi:8957_t:CDS:2, partial [Cetraspora pellucida]